MSVPPSSPRSPSLAPSNSSSYIFTSSRYGYPTDGNIPRINPNLLDVHADGAARARPCTCRILSAGFVPLWQLSAAVGDVPPPIQEDLEVCECGSKLPLSKAAKTPYKLPPVRRYSPSPRYLRRTALAQLPTRARRDSEDDSIADSASTYSTTTSSSLFSEASDASTHDTSLPSTPRCLSPLPPLLPSERPPHKSRMSLGELKDCLMFPGIALFNHHAGHWTPGDGEASYHIPETSPSTSIASLPVQPSEPIVSRHRAQSLSLELQRGSLQEPRSKT